MLGNIHKMKGVLADPVEYYFILNDQKIPLNQYLEKKITLEFTGEIHCIQCGRKTNKSFQQGYCFPCMRRLQECEFCIIHPERCHVEQGTCPQDDWAHRQCYQQHIVYLANASGLKVGITRHNHVPTRWIDQGARQALPIYQVANRYQAGKIEVAFKQYVSDRTNWRAMLKQDAELIDLEKQRRRLIDEAKDGIEQALSGFKEEGYAAIDKADSVEINYPIVQYPDKISSLSLDKTPVVAGVLLGIKGQYLILDTGVINVRKFSGYQVKLNLG